MAYEHLVNVDLLGYFLSRLDTRYAGGSNWAEVNVPASGWTRDTANECYKRTVSISGLTAGDHPTVCFAPPHSRGSLEAAEGAYSLIYAGESTNGGLVLYADDQPATAFKIIIVW